MEISYDLLNFLKQTVWLSFDLEDFAFFLFGFVEKKQEILPEDSKYDHDCRKPTVCLSGENGDVHCKNFFAVLSMIKQNLPRFLSWTSKCGTQLGQHQRKESGPNLTLFLNSDDEDARQDDDGDEDVGPPKKKKTLREVSYEAHSKMCAEATSSLNLMSKVLSKLDKKLDDGFM
ncbi:hypothetical protein AC249_AIPGENE386 [Exaiptasia diaphana]|nr:hypothetical protein AC249_AIPGENE386 [Exaiptasia diaphana]